MFMPRVGRLRGGWTPMRREGSRRTCAWSVLAVAAGCDRGRRDGAWRSACEMPDGALLGIQSR